ncbi:hypothetical protein D3C81_1818870 [compost metagenome]
MLQHRINPADPMTTVPGVMGCDNRLQDIAPISRALFILRIELGQCGITAGFLQPQFQLRFVRVKAHGSGCIRTADALFAYGQPILSG